MKVLLINCSCEQDKNLQERLPGFSPSENNEFIHCSSARESLEIIKKQSFDYVILLTSSLSRKEKQIMGYLSFQYPELRIIVEVVPNDDEPTTYVNKGVYSSGIEQFKDL